MKKTILSAIVLLLIVASCSDKNTFTLNGKFADATDYEGQRVYLQALDSTLRNTVNLDSTVVMNGTFAFKGTITEPSAIRFVSFGDRGIPIPYMLEKGNSTLFVDTTDAEPVITGTPLNDAYKAYSVKADSIRGQMRTLMGKYFDMKEKGEITEALFNEGIDNQKSLYAFWADELLKVMGENSNNALGEYLFLNDSYFLIYTNPDKLDKMFLSFTPEFRNNKRVERLGKLAANRAVTSEGVKFREITGKDINGKDAALSNYIGKHKVILVDFWASWCGPCREALPEMKSLYNQYKDKGFMVVGVSLDSDKAAWEKATKDEGIEWGQISNLKFWDEPAAIDYGVNGIPDMVLIGEDGTIIGRNLSTEALGFKLAKLLK